MWNLYVWEDVFGDYYPGMAVAIARTVDEAREQIAAEYGGRTQSMRENALVELRGDPEVIPLKARGMTPRAWQLSGGD